MHYFDHNATTPLHPAARAALLAALDAGWHNPSAPYRAGARARNALEACRAAVAALFDCAPERVLFNSGATESCDGLLRELARIAGPDARLAIGPVEHPCVREPAHAWWGERCLVLPVEATGRLDLAAACARLDRERPFAVSLQAANNETGVLQPWRELAAFCRARGILFHCDATQWTGKLPLDGLAGCDWLSTGAHKFGGPKGVGILLCDARGLGVIWQRGGAQEGGRRSGTENYPAIAAAVAALQARVEQLAAISTEALAAGRDHLEARLRAAWGDALRVHGASAPRLWNTLSFAPPAHAATRWIARLDRRGLAIASGAACASGKGGPSAVLTAMGVDAATAGRSLRASSGWETTLADWEALAAAILEVEGEMGDGS
jgi:cysteine desulfurase